MLMKYSNFYAVAPSKFIRSPLQLHAPGSFSVLIAKPASTGMPDSTRSFLLAFAGCSLFCRQASAEPSFPSLPNSASIEYEVSNLVQNFSYAARDYIDFEGNRERYDTQYNGTHESFLFDYDYNVTFHYSQDSCVYATERPYKVDKRPVIYQYVIDQIYRGSDGERDGCGRLERNQLHLLFILVKCPNVVQRVPPAILPEVDLDD
eukprot:jgi/Bigna1/68303/fgenesh1_pg.5_\